jgi:type IV pili sensor histidine kinase/response regulator
MTVWQWNRRLLNAALCLGLVAAGIPLGVAAPEVQVGRYATVRAVPTVEQADLLAAQVMLRLPTSMATVGQAVEYLLQSSGYRLAPQDTAEPSRTTPLNLPLPEPHRVLGPMPLKTALETLVGPAFRLVEDPVHRLLSFERCEPAGYRPSASAEAGAR